MRWLIVFVLVGVLGGCSTNVPVKDADKSFNKVIELPNTPKNTIYESAKMWLAERFVSAKAVTQYDNKESGQLIGKGSMDYPCDTTFECMGTPNWKVKFTIKVDVKDNKARMTFKQIGLSYPSRYISGIQQPSYNGPVYHQGHMVKIKRKLLALSDELAVYIKQPPEGKQEDW